MTTLPHPELSDEALTTARGVRDALFDTGQSKAWDVHIEDGTVSFEQASEPDGIDVVILVGSDGTVGVHLIDAGEDSLNFEVTLFSDPRRAVAHATALTGWRE